MIGQFEHGEESRSCEPSLWAKHPIRNEDYRCSKKKKKKKNEDHNFRKVFATGKCLHFLNFLGMFCKIYRSLFISFQQITLTKYLLKVNLGSTSKYYSDRFFNNQCFKIPFLEIIMTQNIRYFSVLNTKFINFYLYIYIYNFYFFIFYFIFSWIVTIWIIKDIFISNISIEKMERV